MISQLSKEIDIQPDGSYSYDNIHVKIEKGVAYVALNRPDKANVLDVPLIENLTELFTRLEQDERVQAVVLTGQGKAFCGGADLNWLYDMYGKPYENNIEEGRKFVAMYELLHNFSKPLIGQVHGPAYAGGVGLVAVCDYALASEGTRFAVTTGKVGLRPSPVATYAIEKLGRHNAETLFYSGQVCGAYDAKAFGLIDEVCTFEGLGARVEQIARQAIRRGKPNLQEQSQNQRQERIDVEGPEPARNTEMERLIQVSSGEKTFPHRKDLLEFMAHDFVIACMSKKAHEKIGDFLESRKQGKGL